MFRLLLCALLCAAPLSAATITVGNTNDAGTGSLRQAVINAVGGDTILFDSSLAGSTITLTSGVIAVGTKALTITGLTDAGGKPDLTISGNNASRIFSTSATFALYDLRLIDGSSSNGAAIAGGPLICGNCVFEGNQASGSGGAILGPVSALHDCAFIANTGSIGGAIESTSISLIERCTFSGNSAGSGGAIYWSNTSGVLTGQVINCTFSGNQSTDSSSGGGGAIFIDTANASVVLTAIHCTFDGNSAANATGGQCARLVAVYISGATTAALNTESCIYADSSANSMFSTFMTAGGSSVFSSFGFNVCSDSPGFMNASSDVTGTNPMLSALADNGGLTQTLAIGASSPALNAGNPVGTTTTDQRGIVRSQPDAGAFELRETTISVTYNGAAAPNGAAVSPAGPATPGTAGSETFSIGNDAAAVSNLDLSLPVTITPISNCTAALGTAPAASIMPGNASDLVVDATPTAEGYYSFSITIVSNDPNASPYTIYLTGYAYIPSSSSGSGGGGDDDSNCSTGGGQSWLWLALLALAGLAVLRPRRG